MNEKFDDAILYVLGEIKKSACTGDDYLKYSQAVCNLANAKVASKDADLMHKEGS